MMLNADEFFAAEDEAARVHRGANGRTDSDEPPIASLAPINPASLNGVSVPPRPWLVADWVPMARATALYGAGGAGKTLLAQMLATACALGSQ